MKISSIYISGRISGAPIEHTRAKFVRAEKIISEKGYKAVNPLNNGLPSGSSWEMHMAMDIILLMGCEAIYLLPCWDNSRGATLEKNIAELTGKKIIYEKEPKQADLKQAIAEVIGVHFWEMANKDSREKVVFARMIFSKMSIQTMRIKDIAKELNHSTSSVHYYLKKYAETYRYHTEFRNLSEQVAERIAENYFNNPIKKAGQ